MMWLSFAALAAVVALLLLQPLWRRRATPTGEPPELAFYRDQLAEIERDAAQGDVTPEQAAASRLEVQRRLLAAAERATTVAASSAAAGSAWRSRLALAVPLVVVLFGGSLGVYLWRGSPGAASLEARGGAGGHPDNVEFAKLIDQLQARLKANPRDVDGWLLLGRSLREEQRLSEAAEAYFRALALSGGQPEIASAYGELLIEIAQGKVTPEALDLFHQALARDPKEPRARFYVGLAKEQGGDIKAAIADWNALLADAPPGAPYITAVREEIAEASRSAGLAPPPAAAEPPVAGASPHGPSAADMAAAANMSDEQRAQMIRGMVDGLAARLQKNPSDVEGWLRLARAYGVLGETDKARDALDQAARHAPADAPNAASVRAQIAELARSTGVPPPPAAAGPRIANLPPAAGAAPRGPSASDMAAAANMSDEQRQQMIRGMVDGLAARQQKNPSDVEGWLRLARAYDVLGETDKARDALAQAAKQPPERLDVLTAYADALYAPEKAGDKPPADYIVVMRRILALEPTNARAMWFVANDAAATGDRAQAASLYKQLLDRLPADAPLRPQVQRQLEAVQKGG